MGSYSELLLLSPLTDPTCLPTSREDIEFFPRSNFASIRWRLGASISLYSHPRSFCWLYPYLAMVPHIVCPTLPMLDSAAPQQYSFAAASILHHSYQLPLAKLPQTGANHTQTRMRTRTLKRALTHALAITKASANTHAHARSPADTLTLEHSRLTKPRKPPDARRAPDHPIPSDLLDYTPEPVP